MLSATPGNLNVTLSWSGGNKFYNVYRGTNAGGPYSSIATTLANTNFTNNTVNNGILYYYVVTGLNILEEESGYSSEAGARPVSTSPTQLGFTVGGSALQFGWPLNHTGWRLQVQTNALNVGLYANWIEVAGPSLTNNVTLPVDATKGTVFYRLVYP